MCLLRQLHLVRTVDPNQHVLDDDNMFVLFQQVRFPPDACVCVYMCMLGQLYLVTTVGPKQQVLDDDNLFVLNQQNTYFFFFVYV